MKIKGGKATDYRHQPDHLPSEKQKTIEEDAPMLAADGSR